MTTRAALVIVTAIIPGIACAVLVPIAETQPITACITFAVLSLMCVLTVASANEENEP